MTDKATEAVARAIWCARETNFPHRARDTWENGSGITKNVTRELAQAAIAAYKAHLESEGLVVVLREPSEEMIDDAAQAVLRHGASDFMGNDTCITVSAALSDEEIVATWRAMLEKSPRP